MQISSAQLQINSLTNTTANNLVNNERSNKKTNSFSALLAGNPAISASDSTSKNQAESIDKLVARINSETFQALIDIGANKPTSAARPAQLAEDVSNQTINEWLNNDGPLPKFIDIVSKERGLSAEQRNSLERIAYEYRDANKTPQTVRDIAGALSAAGIA